MSWNWRFMCCRVLITFLVGTRFPQKPTNLEAAPKPPADMPLLSANSNPNDENALPQRTKRTREARHTTKREQSERAEGEQRFRENCGRCHQPPHKFPPRVMAAAIRHMRVRAMLTDEDMRLILKYMTQ